MSAADARTCCATAATTTGGGTCDRPWGHTGLHHTVGHRVPVWWGNDEQLADHTRQEPT